MAMVAAGSRRGRGFHERRDLLRRRRQQPTSAFLLYVAAARENRGGDQTAGRDREDRKSTSGAWTFRHSTGLKHSVRPEDETSADSLLRAGRRVGVVLRRRTLLRIALTSFGFQAIVRGLSRHTNTGGISLNWPLHENGVLPPEFSGWKARSSSASSVNPASNIS